jgi:hypothetical protein
MRVVLLIAAILAFASTSHAKVKFLRDVKPILENHCVRCHGDSGAMKGLRLDKKERAMMAIVAKKPDESRVYLACEDRIHAAGADEALARRVGDAAPLGSPRARSGPRASNWWARIRSLAESTSRVQGARA